jgi:hypothetical protein
MSKRDVLRLRCARKTARLLSQASHKVNKRKVYLSERSILLKRRNAIRTLETAVAQDFFLSARNIS